MRNFETPRLLVLLKDKLLVSEERPFCQSLGEQLMLGPECSRKREDYLILNFDSSV